MPERGWRALVEQNPHSSWRQRAFGGVFKNLPRLLRRNARKPLYKFGDVRPVFEILKQRGDRYTSATKHPRSTDAPGVAFDDRTG